MSELRVEHCRFEPADTQRENELICEKLLGWRRHPDPELPGWWAPPDDGFFMNSAVDKRFPTFTTWADAGLILDAMAEREVEILVSKYRTNDECWRVIGRWSKDYAYGTTGPVAIRKAALAYIRASREPGAEQ